MKWIWNLSSTSMENVSPTCILHTKKMVNHFFKGSVWALKMFDASTKVPASILMGNTLDFGNYDECQEVKVHEEWGSFNGHHCVAEVQFPINTSKLSLPSFITKLPVRWSLCIPSTCSPSDLEYLLQGILPYNVTVMPNMCTTGNYEPFQTADWIAISVYLMLCILIIMGTAHSLLVKNPEKQNRWLCALSWYNNGRSLFKTKLSPDSLPVLHGIRFLSIAWVVMAHSYEYSGYLPQMNYLLGDKQVRTWKYLIIVNSALAVDTFLVLSGLLLSYVFIKTMERGYHFNLLVFYHHRLLRIWPVLGMCLLFQATLITKLGSGPLWNYVIVNQQSKLCKENWWSTMLFINNYVHVKEMCLPITWFLAVDMQLYWVSPIFLFLLIKKPKLGIGVIIGACIVGIGVSFQQAYYYQDKASIIVTRGQSDDRYYQTHTRFVPWLIGLVCGYIIYKTEDWRNRVAAGRDHLPKRAVISGWMFSIILCIGVIHWIYPMQQEGYEYNAIEQSLYISMSRPLWALGVSWIIFACVSGYGGFINTILTWKAMIPLSRLTYCVYVVHYIVLCIILGDTKSSGYLTHIDEIISLLGCLVLSLILSVFVTLMVETPFLGFEKILLRRVQATSKTSLELGPEHHKKNEMNIKEH